MRVLIGSAILASVVVGCRHKETMRSDTDAATPQTTARSLSSSPTVPPPTGHVGTRESFPFVAAPKVSDIASTPLTCVYDGVKVPVRGVSITPHDDSWRKWRLSLSSRPFSPEGYPEERADVLDLYLPAFSPASSGPLTFAQNGNDAKGESKSAQVILRWNDFFGADQAKDDTGHDATANVLRDGQAYALLFEHFEPATPKKPGKAKLRLYLAIQPTSDAEKKRLPHFTDTSGCNGVFEQVLTLR